MRNPKDYQHLYALPSDGKDKDKFIEQLDQFDGDEQMRTTNKNLEKIKKDQMMQNMCAILCGCLYLVLTALVFMAFVYYYFFYESVSGVQQKTIEYTKSYDIEEPLNPLSQAKTSIKLTQATATQYFAQNQIYAGQIHYSRIPVEYWEHRILMLKAMGLNTLSVYVFWNYHETEKGKFDFETENKNLPVFLELAKKNQMRVLLRPGPYVCAEWDWGGLPARLLAVQGMEIRTQNQLFLNETEVYFKALYDVVFPYLYSESDQKAPILLIQIQNQAGHHSKTTKKYIQRLKQIWQKIGVKIPFYYCDSKKNLQKKPMYWKNAIIAKNGDTYEQEYFSKLNSQGHYVFGGEIYSGWFTGWQSKQYKKQNLTQFQRFFNTYLLANGSFSMYMAHGGTNFGLTAGAFIFKTFKPVITSYDYAAPVSEQGRTSPTFHIFRSLMLNHSTDNNPIKLPKIPVPIKTITFPNHTAKVKSSLFQNIQLQQPYFTSEKLIPFESNQLKMFNQGMMLYRTSLTPGKKHIFKATIHDLGVIYLNQQVISIIHRVQKIQTETVQIDCSSIEKCELQIVVEAMGHVNFKVQMDTDYKGIRQFKFAQAKNSESLKWAYYPLRIQERTPPNWNSNGKCTRPPCLYSVDLKLQQTGDTYINMQQFQKGYVWVNGKLLGRYWKKPQFKLFCPGVWLKEGINEVKILQILKSQNLDKELGIFGEQNLT